MFTSQQSFVTTKYKNTLTEEMITFPGLYFNVRQACLPNSSLCYKETLLIFQGFSSDKFFHDNNKV